MYKSLKILPIIVTLIQACGGGKSPEESETIPAPVISSSAYSGFAFSAVNKDRNIRTSRLYFYDFKAGVITEKLAGESGSPGLFFKDSKLFVVNRDSGNQNLKIIDNIKAETIVPASVELEGLLPGEPSSIETVFPGKILMIGAQESEKIFKLDYQSGELVEVDTSNLEIGKIRATGLQRTGSVINVIHSGVKKLAADSYLAEGNQAVFRVKVESEGSTSFIDEDATTSEIDGKPLKATNPVLAGTDGTTLSLIGLCSNIISGCIPAIENYSSGSVTLINDFASTQTFEYQLVNQIIAGPFPDQVYAHVSTPAGEYKIILLNTSTLAVTEVHTFSDYYLYGFNFDKSSNTLLVGEAGDLSGTLFVYQNQVLKEKVELSGVLSSSVFIP